MATKTQSKSSKKAKAKATAKKRPASAERSRSQGGARRDGPRQEGRRPDNRAEARPEPRPRPANSTGTRQSAPPRPAYVPRAVPVVDDDEDVLMTHGAGGGAGYGRCGGRMLGSTLEQTICDRLGQAGVAHSHSPRHFEVLVTEKQVAAYAPMLVLRGRGREGKSVVIECAEQAQNPMIAKILAFRRQYGQEYYVIFVAPDEVLDEVELATYDEACSATDVNTLISRLAE